MRMPTVLPVVDDLVKAASPALYVDADNGTEPVDLWSCDLPTPSAAELRDKLGGWCWCCVAAANVVVLGKVFSLMFSL